MGRKVIERASQDMSNDGGEDPFCISLRIGNEVRWRMFAIRLAHDPDSRERVIASITRQRETLAEVAQEVQIRLGEPRPGGW